MTTRQDPAVREWVEQKDAERAEELEEGWTLPRPKWSLVRLMMSAARHWGLSWTAWLREPVARRAEMAAEMLIEQQEERYLLDLGKREEDIRARMRKERDDPIAQNRRRWFGKKK